MNVTSGDNLWHTLDSDGIVTGSNAEFDPNYVSAKVPRGSAVFIGEYRQQGVALLRVVMSTSSDIVYTIAKIDSTYR